ncbi:MAG: hypothetical protein AAGG51_29355 [Cyanobacteria bacterium P01_G01_bin.54]
MNDVLIVILIIFGVIAILAMSFYLSRRRTQAIEALAVELGFNFGGRDRQLLPDPVWQFDLFSKGRSRSVANLIWGQREMAEVYLFDYSYHTGTSRKRSQPHRQTVVCLSSQALNLPPFLLVPENIFHKLGNLFGYHDIDFPNYPNFSRRYLLRGADEADIRDCFHLEVIEAYEARSGVSTEGKGSCLIYYYSRRGVAPKNWPELMDEALAVYRQFRRL